MQNMSQYHKATLIHNSLGKNSTRTYWRLRTVHIRYYDLLHAATNTIKVKGGKGSGFIYRLY